MATDKKKIKKDLSDFLIGEEKHVRQNGVVNGLWFAGECVAGYLVSLLTPGAVDSLIAIGLTGDFASRFGPRLVQGQYGPGVLGRIRTLYKKDEERRDYRKDD